MSRISLVVMFVLPVSIGCSQNTKDTTQIEAKARSLASKWHRQDLGLPNKETVDYFDANFENTKSILWDKLHSVGDIPTRMRAAYVIEQIGPKAHSFQDRLLMLLGTEDEPRHDIYLADALFATSDGESLDDVRAKYQASATSNLHVTAGIYAAALLSVFSPDEQEREECTSFVCEQLKLPKDELEPGEVEEFWQRRWAAVNALEHMEHAAEAIPLLNGMLEESDRHSWVTSLWVDRHVPRVLAALQEEADAGPQEGVSQTEWTPPETFGRDDENILAEAEAILDEAEADAKAASYDEALAKHVWLYRQAQDAGGLFAAAWGDKFLPSWIQLGSNYPSAKSRLLGLRDGIEATILRGKCRHSEVVNLVAINASLEDDERTIEFFRSLDQLAPETAAEIFPVVRPVLLAEQEYTLSTNYLQPREEYRQLVMDYYSDMRLAATPEGGEQVAENTSRKFAKNVAVLVALLSLSGEQEEAAAIAADAKKIRGDEEFATELEKALSGEVPESMTASTTNHSDEPSPLSGGEGVE